jgi:galactokinase
VHADKAGSVKERYNRAADTARALLRLWNRMSSARAASLAAVVGRPGAVDQLRTWIAGCVLPDATPAELWRRLDHFLAEDRIVSDAAAACAGGDVRAVGDLALRSQRHAEELLDNQVPETRVLAALARDLGAHGATSFGAGFGGSVWALVDRGDAAMFARAWLDAYRRQQPDMSNVRWFVARPGPGLSPLPVERI